MKSQKIGPNWKVVQPDEIELLEISKQSYYHTEIVKECQLCGVRFRHGRSNAKLCGCCHVFLQCNVCNKMVEVDKSSLSGTAMSKLIDDVENMRPIYRPCSRECHYMDLNTRPKMKEQARNNCTVMNDYHVGKCRKCFKIAVVNGYGLCKKCYAKKGGYSLKLSEGSGYHKEFCEICERITMHNGHICCECHPESNGQYGINGRINSQYRMLHCDICEAITPHDDKQKNCLSCSGKMVWCDHCQIWETPENHSVPLHWRYWRSNVREWTMDHVDLLENTISIIDGWSDIKDGHMCGIYEWSIDGTSYYIGQAQDVEDRSHSHIMEMNISPEYWLNIVEEASNGHTLSIKVLEECSPEELDERELFWIDKRKPLSQKCDGTDRIKRLEDRDFSIDSIGSHAGMTI